MQFDTVMTLSQATVLLAYEMATRYVVENIFQLSKKNLRRVHGDHISQGWVTRAAQVRLFVNLFSAILLQCDYYNRGHLDKVD